MCGSSSPLNRILLNSSGVAITTAENGPCACRETNMLRLVMPESDELLHTCTILSSSAEANPASSVGFIAESI